MFNGNSNYDKDGFYVLRRKVDTVPHSFPLSQAVLSPETIVVNGFPIGDHMLEPIDNSLMEPDYLGDMKVGSTVANQYACSMNPKSWVRKAWDRVNDVEIPDPAKSTFRFVANPNLRKVVRLVICYKAGVVVKGNSTSKKCLARYPEAGLDYVAIDSVDRLTSVINEIASKARTGFSSYYAKNKTAKVVRTFNSLKLLVVYQDATYSATLVTPRQLIEMFGLIEDPITKRISVPMKNRGD